MQFPRLFRSFCWLCIASQPRKIGFFVDLPQKISRIIANFWLLFSDRMGTAIPPVPVFRYLPLDCLHISLYNDVVYTRFMGLCAHISKYEHLFRLILLSVENSSQAIQRRIHEDLLFLTDRPPAPASGAAVGGRPLAHTRIPTDFCLAASPRLPRGAPVSGQLSILRGLCLYDPVGGLPGIGSSSPFRGDRVAHSVRSPKNPFFPQVGVTAVPTVCAVLVTESRKIRLCANSY